jgi:NTP pyrophosphatase (non-canonical NTP hydrolase)
MKKVEEDRTAVQEIFEQFNLLSDRDFKSWMFANVDRLEKQDDKIVSLIAHWSKTFDLPIKKEKGFPDKSRTTLALRLIEEEYKETFQACAEGNLKETEDGFGDLLWVTIRGMMEHGINPLETIERIYTSNMSKADYNQDDAEFTRNKYLREGIETYCRVVGGTYLTYRAFDDKLLKSAVNYKEPKL